MNNEAEQSVENSEGEGFSAEEQAYFDGQGADESHDSDSVERNEENTPEQASEEELKPTEDAEPVKTVPHGALHAEREEHKKTKADMQKLRDAYNTLQGRTNLILEALNNQQQTEKNTPTQAPDLNEDPIGYIQFMAKNINGLQQQMQQQAQMQQQTEQTAQREREINSVWDSSIAAAATDHPDINEAVQFAAQSRYNELKSMGFDDVSCKRQIYADISDVVVAAKQRGLDPAAIAYSVAQNRGYRYQAPVTATEQANKTNAALSASKTLTNSNGAPSKDMSLEMINSMSDADFDKWMEKNSGKLRNMLGE